MPDETPWPVFDDLSAPARAVLGTNPRAYTHLVVHGDINPASRELLARLSPTNVLAHPARNSDDVRPLLAGLWLWHDALEESHTISQALPSATGSFWHAIMHRREGDFSNAKYWYCRVGNHLAMPTIAARVDLLTQSLPSDKAIFRLTAGGWRPEAFVDLVEAVNADPNDPRRQLAVDIGKIEWHTLLETTLREA